jgi:hypothetical protein
MSSHPGRKIKMAPSPCSLCIRSTSMRIISYTRSTSVSSKWTTASAADLQ